MTYKVLVVTALTGSCCSPAPSLDQELEQACNKMAAHGYVLIAAYPETINQCGGCQNQVKRAVFLIFAHP